MAVAVGIEEDFEVIIVEDNAVVTGEGGPNVRLFQLGADVQASVVPQQLDARAEARCRSCTPFDVREVLAPRRGLPGILVELAVEYGWLLRPVADVTARMGGSWFLSRDRDVCGTAILGPQRPADQDGEQESECESDTTGH